MPKPSADHSVSLPDLRTRITSQVLALLADLPPLEGLRALQAPTVRQAQDVMEAALHAGSRDAALQAGREWYRTLRAHITANAP